MKFYSAISFAVVCGAVSASTIPRSLQNGRQLKASREFPVNHWIAEPLAEKNLPVAAVGTRGGGDVQLAKNTLWAAFGFNVLVALAAAFNPNMIGDILFTTSIAATDWPCHLLAIMSAGSAISTLLAIQDASSHILKLAGQTQIVTLGAAAIYAVYQYSQSIFDNQNCLGFIAVTGILAATLVKAIYM